MLDEIKLDFGEEKSQFPALVKQDPSLALQELKQEEEHNLFAPPSDESESEDHDSEFFSSEDESKPTEKTK